MVDAASMVWLRTVGPEPTRAMHASARLGFRLRSLLSSSDYALARALKMHARFAGRRREPRFEGPATQPCTFGASDRRITYPLVYNTLQYYN